MLRLKPRAQEMCLLFKSVHIAVRGLWHACVPGSVQDPERHHTHRQEAPFMPSSRGCQAWRGKGGVQSEGSGSAPDQKPPYPSGLLCICPLVPPGLLSPSRPCPTGNESVHPHLSLVPPVWWEDTRRAAWSKPHRTLPE